MLKPDARAGGCFLSLFIFVGFVIGLSLRDPLAGVWIGTLAGAAVAAIIWLSDRARRGGDV